jgi:hypothetical protein
MLPATMMQGANGPALCGAVGCPKLVVDALRAAVVKLQGPMMRAGPEDWRWGSRHALKMRTLFPDPNGVLLLPRREENEIGFHLAGDVSSVDRTDGGWRDADDFTPRAGAAYRIVFSSSFVGIDLDVHLELPTGTVFDPRDPHYRDLLEKSYLTRTAFDAPFTIFDINDAGETRWEMR